MDQVGFKGHTRELLYAREYIRKGRAYTSQVERREAVFITYIVNHHHDVSSIVSRLQLSDRQACVREKVNQFLGSPL